MNMSSAVAAIFLGTSFRIIEFHIDFYEIEFYNSIKLSFYDRLPVVEMCLKKCLIAQNENNNYIRHVLYLWNSIADDHGLWYTCVK